jgi:hypothetical protein
MLACDGARDRMAPWIAGEMEPAACRELEAHLRACPGCSAEAEHIRRALALLETVEAPDPGPLYWSSFGPRLRARLAASARRRRALRLAAVAAAAALAVAGLAMLQFRHGTAPPVVAAGGRPETRPAPQALPVEEAEARLSAVLRQAVAEGQDLTDLDAILDEIAPLDPLDAADALGRISPEEGRSLSEDLLDSKG